ALPLDGGTVSEPTRTPAKVSSSGAAISFGTVACSFSPIAFKNAFVEALRCRELARRSSVRSHFRKPATRVASFSRRRDGRRGDSRTPVGLCDRRRARSRPTVARKGRPRFLCSAGATNREALAQLQIAFRERCRPLFAAYPPHGRIPCGPHIGVIASALRCTAE